MKRQRRPPRWRWLAAFLTCLALPAQAVLPLQLDERGLAPAQADAGRQLLQAVQERLPSDLPRPPAPLQVQWRDDLPDHVRGRALGRKLLLDRRLLDDWLARPLPLREDDPASRAAMAALIHEIAHALDRSPQGGWSRDARFRDLAGWQVRPLRAGRGRNAFSDRSPDRYELHSPAEFFAVNLEHYLLDADYACRRPALHAWFAQRFGLPPLAPPSECATGLPYLQAEAEEGAASLLALDPARVYAVDYLLAEGNERPMSRWGHSMLRLVICAPGRVPGPACRMDLQHHRVLSFRAFIGDVQISSWRGLTGSYPSRLFVLPLDQVIDEYTKVELRGLSSIPLQLDEAEIAGLLQRAARVHWSYDGRYYFIGNNCAVETFKLLHDGVPRLAALPLSGITPRGLLRRLQRNGIADGSVLDDPAEAVRLGHYFESAAAHYQAMFEVVRAALPVPQQDMEQWLRLPPATRRSWLEQVDSGLRPEQALRTSAALLLLEQAAQRRLELEARDVLKRQLLARRGAGRDDALQALQRLLEDAGMMVRPASLLAESGYGLPQGDELQRLHGSAQALSERGRQGWQRLREQLRAGLPAQQQADMREIEANLAIIGARLRQSSRVPATEAPAGGPAETPAAVPP